jgi:hypothetical protein
MRSEDELVDTIVKRVLDHLGPDAVREVVNEVISGLAQRLLREELERQKKVPGA